jgi:hypothetical protein
MNAPVFPSNPTIGQVYQNWAWNGARWVCNPMAGVQIIQTVITATGPYQPSPGLVSVEVECLGGGGGGGAAQSDLASAAVQGWMMGGGGGSSGGYSKSTLAASLVLGGVSVTIGAAGAGGLSATASPGTVGGATTFGALVTANGGLGGGAGIPGYQFGDGGPRAQPGTGQIASPGSAGETGVGYYYDTSAIAGMALGGQGGSGFFGGVNRNVSVTAGLGVNGMDGALGSGGGGGAAGLVAVTANGGNGGPGMCIVTEYCWMDTADEDCGCPPTTTGRARVALGGGAPWHGDPFD